MVMEDLFLSPDFQSESEAGEKSGALEVGVSSLRVQSHLSRGSHCLSTNSFHRITLLYLELKVGKSHYRLHLGNPNSL